MALVVALEGGAVYTAERGSAFLIIIDESAAFDVLDPNDQEGLEPCKELEFSSVELREAYLRTRGWVPDASREVE